jgi:hypothetical protein
VVGENNQASGDDTGNFVFGENNQASGEASGNFVAGFGNQAFGDFSGNFVAGVGNQASGIASGNFVLGANNQASGFVAGNGVAGFNNQASGAFVGNGVVGENNQAYGQDSGNGVAGENNIAMGDDAGNNVYGNSNIAIGDGAGGNIATDDTISIGTDASAQKFHSTAIGAGAVAEKDHLMVFGTKDDTYRTPGITSNLSKNRQSGPLEVVTSDAGGNLATDGGQIFDDLDGLNHRVDRLNRRSDEAFAGVALAMASTGPDLTGNERFGVSANWGNFEGANAFGMGLEGVLAYDVFTRGDRFAVTGGWGVGFEDGNNGHNGFGSNDDDTVFGGRVGAQWTWGHKPAAYVLK